jgi:hypothetical protein
MWSYWTAPLPVSPRWNVRWAACTRCVLSTSVRGMSRAQRNPSRFRTGIDGYRCTPPILRTGCAALIDANRAPIKIQLLASCHALLGSEHCSRAPLSHEIEI